MAETHSQTSGNASKRSKIDTSQQITPEKGTQDMAMEDVDNTPHSNKAPEDSKMAQPNSGSQTSAISGLFTFKAPIIPVKTTWHMLIQDLRNHQLQLPMAFGPDSEYGETQDHMHEAVKVFRRATKTPVSGKLSLQALINWMRDQLGCADQDETVLLLTYHFSMTDPVMAFHKDSWEQGILLETDTALIWRAAYAVFGAPWAKSNHKKFFEKHVQLPAAGPTPSLAPKGYINRPLLKAAQETARLDGCKFQTFIKVKLPRIQTSTPREQDDEIASAFDNLLHCLWSDNNTLLVLPWQKDSTLPMLSVNNKMLPRSTNGYRLYTNWIWVNLGSNPYVRLII